MWPVLIFARSIFGSPEFSDLLRPILTFPTFGGIRDGSAFLVNSPLSAWIALALGLLLVGLEVILRRHPLGRGRNYKYLRTPSVLVILAIATVLLASGALGEISAAYAQR